MMKEPSFFSYQKICPLEPLYFSLFRRFTHPRRVYLSMSLLATVRFAEHIDRFVKGQVIVGEWCALIASGLVQDQFVWLSLKGQG